MEKRPSGPVRKGMEVISEKQSSYQLPEDSFDQVEELKHRSQSSMVLDSSVRIGS